MVFRGSRQGQGRDVVFGKVLQCRREVARDQCCDRDVESAGDLNTYRERGKVAIIPGDLGGRGGPGGESFELEEVLVPGNFSPKFSLRAARSNCGCFRRPGAQMKTGVCQRGARD
jgi:hypothetical protein